MRVPKPSASRTATTPASDRRQHREGLRRQPRAPSDHATTDAASQSLSASWNTGPARRVTIEAALHDAFAERERAVRQSARHRPVERYRSRAKADVPAEQGDPQQVHVERAVFELNHEREREQGRRTHASRKSQREQYRADQLHRDADDRGGGRRKPRHRILELRQIERRVPVRELEQTRDEEGLREPEPHEEIEGGQIAFVVRRAASTVATMALPSQVGRSSWGSVAVMRAPLRGGRSCSERCSGSRSRGAACSRARSPRHASARTSRRRAACRVAAP